MSWQGKVYVTASNPAPGQPRPIEGDPTHQLSDQGLGINTYIAGGWGPGGAVPVSQTNPVSISLSGVSISGVMQVTSSFDYPVAVTGSIFVVNPVTGTYVLGTASVSVSNWPATQSVSFITPVPVTQSAPIQVSFSGSPAQGVYIQDTSSNPVLVTTDGQRSLAVSDEAVFNVLDKILKELKKANVYLSTMTDMELDNEDIH